MNAILEVITQNILPIFLVAGLGFWLRRSRGVPTRPVSSVVFNAFSPALVFVSLSRNQLEGGELTALIAFAVASILIMGLLAYLAGRLLRLERTALIALVLVAMFVNSGNYGLTLNQLRYGDDGLSRAVVYYVTSTLLIYSLGVFIASMGRGDGRSALAGVARVPAVYAVVLAIAVYTLQLTLPAPLQRALEIAAAGAIPAMLIVLGMNMAEMDGLTSWRLVLPAASLRLLIAPLVAVALAASLGLRGLANATSIIQASMPTAVIVTVLANEFDIHAAVVTRTILVTTLLSPLTLALVITILAL